MAREKHLVFQVINFLHDHHSPGYTLLPIDKFILITLAAHNGQLGICPSLETLAFELNITRRYIDQRIKSLEKSQLIDVYKKGKTRYYHLLFLDEYSAENTQKLSTGEAPQSHKKISTVGTTVPKDGTTVPKDGTTVPKHIKNIRTDLRTKKGTKRGSFLSKDFQPSRVSEIYARGLGLTEAQANKAFDNFLKFNIKKNIRSEDWDKVLQAAFDREKQFVKANNNEEHERELAEMEQRIEDARRSASREGSTGNAGAFLGKLMQQGKQQMEHTNGLGSEGQGATEEERGRTAKATGTDGRTG